VALIRTDVSEGRIASIFRLHECEQVTERRCKLLYRHRLVGDIICEPGWRSRYSDCLRAGRPRGRSSSPDSQNFLFSISSRPALGPTQRPIQ
jgi:hypothetical protein